VGFIVSKAVGNAVTRNRVKRRLRHLSRGLLEETPRHTLVVVRALPPASSHPDVLADELDAAWAQALRKLDRVERAREQSSSERAREQSSSERAREQSSSERARERSSSERARKQSGSERAGGRPTQPQSAQTRSARSRPAQTRDGR
jgi:RNase P protein component